MTFNNLFLIEHNRKSLLLSSALITVIISIYAQENQLSGTGANYNANPSKELVNKSLKGNGLVFTQNKGQIIDTKEQLRPDVLYKGEGGGTDIYIRKSGISYVLSNKGEVMHEVEEEIEELERSGNIVDKEKIKKELLSKQTLQLHRVDVDFVNCNSSTLIQTADQVEGYTNYYFNYCPAGITHVNSYNEITQKNIYNNIDVKYYGGKERGLKYDIIVKAGGDPNEIQLQYIGAKELKLDSKEYGEKLIVETSLGQLGEYMPRVYQNINGKIVDVKAYYVLEGSTVSFKLETWNKEHALIIDPWASYYGGKSSEVGNALTTDQAGNVMFTGWTDSPDFPFSAGALQTAINGNLDAFVVKMNVNGGRLWATYWGGSSQDMGNGIVTDIIGNVLVTGSAASNNFPVGSAAGYSVHQPALSGPPGGTTNAFLTKFDPNGSLLFSTYYGGSTWNVGVDVVTDGSNIYMYGITSASSAISTPGSFQPALNGASDVFVAKFNSTGTRTWATYVGGSSDEGSSYSGGGIAYDALSGNIYIAGTTNSADFPVTAGVHQVTYGGGATPAPYSGMLLGDAFLFKLNSAGVQVWATYYGGSANDYGNAVEVDGFGNVIIAGNSASTTANVISSAGSNQPTYGGTGGTNITGDGYIAKFSNTGVRQWATYLGGNKDEFILSLAIDASNFIYAYGEWEDTDAGNYTMSSCSYQPIWAGVEDPFIAKYNPTGQQVCATYLGGPGEDDLDFSYSGGAIDVYNNYIYITGFTSGNYPVSAGAYQTVYSGGFDAYITQLCTNICEPRFAAGFTPGPSTICKNTSINFLAGAVTACDTTGVRYKWTFTGGTPASSTLPNPSVTYANSGFFSVKLVVSTTCQKDSLIKTDFIVNSCTINATATGGAICPGSCASVTASGSSGVTPYTYSWSNGGTTATINPCPSSNTTYSVVVTDASGNTAGSIATVSLRAPIIGSVYSQNVTCTTSGVASVNATNGATPYTYLWSSGQTSSSINGISGGGYAVTVTDANGCNETRTFVITDTNPVDPSFTYSSPCVGTQVNFTNTGTSGGSSTYYWEISAPANVSGTTNNFSHTFLATGNYSVTHYVYNGTCGKTLITNITVTNCANPTVTASGNSVCPNSCGTVTASASGGASPYTYSWSTGATTQNINPCPSSTTTYTVTITDSGGATSTSTAAVTIYAAVSLSTSSTNVNCSGSNDGTATANPGGGTSPYTFSWSTGGTTSQISNLTSQIYSITVTDSKGCTATSTTTINSPPPLAGKFSKGTANCFGCGCKEWVMITATGGTSPYNYSWPDSYTNRYKNQLCPGTYTIDIKDKNGCSVNVNLTTP